jgi:hypothetical protein
MNVDRLRFREPVRVLAAPGQPIDDIRSVEQALYFLQQWPGARQGPVYRAALNACSAAIAAQISTEDARKSFASFARITGTLVEENDTSPSQA